MSDLEQFTDAYIECALWSSNDESDESGGVPFDDNYSAQDLAPDAGEQMRADCAAFFNDWSADIEKHCLKYGPDLDTKAARAGHDFWLTRNGHGAGFWDGDWSEPGATVLSDASKRYRECNLILGDDGLIYLM